MAHAIPASIFRAYDIRGIFGNTLTEDYARLIGQAIGSTVLAAGGTRMAVARDGRLSGPALVSALCEGIQASGCHVVDIGMVPTPVLYFATHHFDDLNSGVMITGSHNPKDYNGFKIVVEGVTLSGDAITALYEMIVGDGLASGQGTLEQREILPAYLEAIVSLHKLPKPLKVVVDSGNGVPGVIDPKAIADIGAEVVELYSEVDGNFPNHHPDPGDPHNLEDLIAAMKETGADLGLAFDGDGDRVGVVTPKGEVVYPDILMMALAEDVISRHPGAKVIFDVKCTGKLAEVVSAAGGEPEMWRTGHSFIKARMKETGALLAGEMSGHIFFAEDWFGVDDALVAACRLLKILAASGVDADTLFGRYPKLTSTPEINIDVTDDNKFDIVEYLQTRASFSEGTRCVLDGIRMDYDYGWGLCRASNTSPKLVTRYEAVDEANLAKIRAEFEANIQAAIEACG